MYDGIPLPVRRDLEVLDRDLAKATDEIISSQTASEEEWKLEAFREALGLVRGVRFALAEIASRGRETAEAAE
jgi:hypothetical protein